MTLLDQIPFDPDMNELRKELRIQPGSGHDSELRDLVARAKKIARPKSIYQELYIEGRDAAQNLVEMGGVRLKSRILYQNLEEVQRAFPFVTTCGTELDKVEMEKGDLVTAYWLDVIKEKALFGAMEFLTEHLQSKYRFKQVSFMSPGSGDRGVWSLKEQKPLFELLGDTERLAGVCLTESYLMTPAKTVSGVAFPTETSFESCQACTREGCPKRRAPFNEKFRSEISD